MFFSRCRDTELFGGLIGVRGESLEAMPSEGLRTLGDRRLSVERAGGLGAVRSNGLGVLALDGRFGRCG